MPVWKKAKEKNWRGRCAAHFPFSGQLHSRSAFSHFRSYRQWIGSKEHIGKFPQNAGAYISVPIAFPYRNFIQIKSDEAPAALTYFFNEVKDLFCFKASGNRCSGMGA